MEKLLLYTKEAENMETKWPLYLKPLLRRGLLETGVGKLLVSWKQPKNTLLDTKWQRRLSGGRGRLFWDCLKCGTPAFAEVTEVVPGIGLRTLWGCHS